MSAEFAVFAADGSSPVVDWIRLLCADLARETGGDVGAIGLCITGGFTLSLTVGTNGKVTAPVMSEPSLPFALPFTHNDAALHLTCEEQEEIRANGSDVMGLRFTGDALCKKARFDAYEALLGTPRFKRIELTSPDPTNDIGPFAYSVFTKDLVNAPNNPTVLKLAEVLDFLDARLKRGTRSMGLVALLRKTKRCMIRQSIARHHQTLRSAFYSRCISAFLRKAFTMLRKLFASAPCVLPRRSLATFLRLLRHPPSSSTTST